MRNIVIALAYEHPNNNARVQFNRAGVWCILNAPALACGVLQQQHTRASAYGIYVWNKGFVVYNVVSVSYVSLRYVKTKRVAFGRYIPPPLNGIFVRKFT